ncbi:MAG: DNA gyrase inhibitor YacG [Gammaproteobacteria bacterium]|nr:DNA gyrase inhibitor YacG [Gammaproteobacteria bacterium]MCP5406490.1 DNA gyrase inhibitor YacG [Chromatiaceae bacterium]MCP5408158.1 DNA gyrase inhibitor YacG [Chromatiaceae bacterium]MCP5443057.1 DNA gyrase inhibitor YacG [Chromatiaceae bacterium]
MKQRQTKARCPTCKISFSWTQDSPWRPFCSERCRLIDLGEWLNEGHRIHGEPEQAEPFRQPEE